MTTESWGGANGPPGGLGSQGSFVAGQVRHYQVVYRDDVLANCMTGLNTSQAVTVVFAP